MGIQEASITLDNPHNSYVPGQVVNGRIQYVFDSPKKVRGIYVVFKGEANTFWTETETEHSSDGNSDRQVENPYTANEEYFNVNYYIIGSKNGNEIELPAGTHGYDFTCSLPPSLPSSFEGKYGYVRYTIKVTLDRPMKFDQDTKMAFTVVHPFDLNNDPECRKPITMQLEKTFGCCCCLSAPMSVDVQVPFSGFCAGQAIPIQVEIENKSNVQLQLLKVALRKVITYRATTPRALTKKEKDIVVQVQQGPVPTGQTRSWTLNLEIPSIPPSNLVNCGIIDLDYDIKVECQVSGIHLNFSDRKYVKIGTVPLMAAQDIQNKPAGDANPGNTAGGWVLPNYQLLYPTLSEPVYRESPFQAMTVIDKGDSEHTRVAGNVNFAPMYPTYSMPLPPQ